MTGIALLLMLARLGYFTAIFARESLQMDFAAYYTAGEALNRGLDPYVNHVTAAPPLWDGVARYSHSRFLYPPLAAYLFRPLARVPYATAKALWTALGVLSTGASLAGAAWIIGARRITPVAWAGIGAATAGFHPLFTHLERGQIDALTLLILMISIGLMIAPQRHGSHSHERSPLDAHRGHWIAAAITAGLFLALATLLKLHVGLIVPFLVLRKRWGTLAGYAVGLLLIAGASLLVAPQLSRAYVTEHLPRISVYGEGGTAEMLLPQEQLDALLEGVPEGMTVKGPPDRPVTYRREAFGFFANATLVRYFSPMLAQSPLMQRLGLHVSVSQLSLGLFALLFGAIYLGQRLCQATATTLYAAPSAELLYWNLVLIVISITAPQTWVMNLVWLLPLVVILAADLPGILSAKPAPLAASAVAALWVAALAAAGIPDRFIAAPYIPILARIPERWLYPLGWERASHKYLVAQGLLLAAAGAYAIVMVARNRMEHAASRTRSARIKPPIRTGDSR